MPERLPVGLSWAVALGLWGSTASTELQSLPRGLNVDAREERYVIEADGLAGVIATLNEMRLEGEDGPLSQGLTDYRVTPQWRVQALGSGCGLTSVTVDVDITITLPGWPGAVHASAVERRRWEELLLRITRHEYRHRDITVAVASDLLASLKRLEAGTCAGVRRAAASALALAEEELRRQHAELDASSHGR